MCCYTSVRLVCVAFDSVVCLFVCLFVCYRAVLYLLESSAPIQSLKIDAWNDYLAVACTGAGLVFIWKCKKVSKYCSI